MGTKTESQEGLREARLAVTKQSYMPWQIYEYQGSAMEERRPFEAGQLERSNPPGLLIYPD